MIPSSTWEKVVENNGLSREVGLLNGDPFAALATQANEWRAQGLEPSRVNVLVGNGIEYNQVKVSITLTIVCPPHEKYIQVASEAGFLKALEMVNEASETIGMPPLPKAY